MISMYQYLLEKNYSSDEAEETVVRWENGLEIPDEILFDVRKYLDLRYFGMEARCCQEAIGPLLVNS